jgi:hypothetical protein
MLLSLQPLHSIDSAQIGHGRPHSTTPEPAPPSRDRPKTPKTPHLTTAHARASRPSTPDPLRDHASAGLEIERPRSALHSGDFRGKQDAQSTTPSSSGVSLATSPVVPWKQSFPAAARPPTRAEPPYVFQEALDYDLRSTARTRAISQSSFSSFVFMPPTSPLVQQSNNTDLDFSSRPGSRQPSKSPERGGRRHTFSPQSFQTFKSTHLAWSAAGSPAARHMKKGTTIPYQAHQPRRSLTSLNQAQSHSDPQTPFLRPRRPSFSSDASPLHHAPMVGSYEESILRGRMSTTPSRPLDFIAKIGVLGRGQCKSSLRCPPHVTVPFPAVFYSYSSGNGHISDDSPSPYVGLIDLENSLSPPEENSETGKRKRRQTAPVPEQIDAGSREEAEHLDARYRSTGDIRRSEKKKRRSTSPKTPPGGSYRIPQQGQLQIVIKNPNKTAVKLFLVPYDLSDMEPGQKTFIRQRSYSAGPIIDMPLSSRKNLGTDRPEAALSHSDDPSDRPILRYLVHLHMCCPSKGRYYLYKSIRVVFANRVPDGKEKLRNEIQLPEPRYSTYRPQRDSLATPSSLAAQLTAEKALRRRSAGTSLTQQSYGTRSRIHPPLPPPAVEFTGGPSHFDDFSSPVSVLEPIPFSLSHLPMIPSRPLSFDSMDVDEASPHTSQPASESSVVASPGSAVSTFEKLSRGDVGYGGNAFSPPASPGAGLLARRLRGLDVYPGGSENSEDAL